ncbi:tetratricopeptide repeat protein [Demequina sp. NBRC 110055]|uniref:tetratricopeptide repeat protein n=1 Tax=Demequina sp. NBRC 110055 TaxID=1570344 RepID=UPI001F36BE83|nr:tetratricopeptide repeat protein [Demequina sp. NBRC 110055]
MPTEAERWERQVADLWATADRSRPGAVLARARALVGAREDGDAAALFELASAHDFVGEEAVAIGVYERALDAGLDPRRHDEAIIQLASSLRHVDRSADAVALLASSPVAPDLAPAAAAFRVLALYDLGRASQVEVSEASAAAQATPYGRAVARYAAALQGSPTSRP